MTAVEFIEPLTHEEGVSQATKLFVDTYGAAPEGVWAAPGRVNLIGEHTDYNAGLCLPIALPHRTFIALKPREDTKVRVVSDVAPDKVAEADLDGLKARGVDGWSAYPTGVAWALREAGFDKVKGFVCVELNMGQMKQDVELAVRCKKPVSLCRRVGGMIPTPDEVLASIQTMAEGGANA